MSRTDFIIRGRRVVLPDRVAPASIHICDGRISLVGAFAEITSDVELIEGVYPEFEVEEYLSGKVAPVFFGSAVNNFGVKELLDTFIRIAPPPIPAGAEAACAVWLEAVTGADPRAK